KPGVKRPPKDECFRTSYTHGQLWLQYKPNCHQYIVCEPRGPGKYVKHIMSCGTTLYWNQKWHACSREKTGDCLDVSAITTTLPPTVAGESHGWINDILLHFANDSTDHTCHRAVLNLYGDGMVMLVFDPLLKHYAAEFDGRGYLEVPFIRTWFANNHVDAFSISLWFNRQGSSDVIYGALVNNGDSVEKPGFCLRAIENNKLAAKIRTTSPTGWHHVAYVYNGKQLTLTVDNTATNSVAITGTVSALLYSLLVYTVSPERVGVLEGRMWGLWEGEAVGG
ncbi:hypothetical protein NP493_423g01014, partial [Ridgeia piscesae]